MKPAEWALSVKPDLVLLQRERQIPALFAAAQMCHESAYADGLSELATKHSNYAGLKFAQWQTAYGCQPVAMRTWEVVDGLNTSIDDAFCSCPSWEVWLKVYSSLLTGQFYGGARKYADDPFLYAMHVWQRGWATDPAYLAGIGGWMSRLWDDYKDTLPRQVVKPPESPEVELLLDGEKQEFDLRLVDGQLYGRVRPFLDMVARVGYGWFYNGAKRVLSIDAPKAN